ncbi:MAG: hypothetical protein Q8920_13030 [Bacillota bacterium]|nr:hypothetical protein [Bacillota bacterium]
MSTKEITKNRRFLISLLVIFFSAAFAIGVHAIVPASVDFSKLDGILVKQFGFPIIAVSYFLILYIQCTFSVMFICNRTNVSNLQIGIRLGISFALIYLVGMQEVVVESSPFSTYGFNFIKYQFFMGLGDAIPVIVLCIVIALIAVKKYHKVPLIPHIKKAKNFYAIIIITVGFLIERTIGYETGIINNNCDKYALPCYTWTVLFGIMLGSIYIILYPVLAKDSKRNRIPIRLLIIIGLNWIIFNSFIGLIMKGTMPQSLLRSGLDSIVLFIASSFIGRFVIKEDAPMT